MLSGSSAVAGTKFATSTPEFLNQIKGDSAFVDTPVVIISTEGKEEDTIRGLEAGAAAYIKKPFGNQELLEVIQRL